MTKDWICYGWAGTFCHTALNFFASEKDGACYKLPDRDYEEETYPFTLYYAVVHKPTPYTLNRKIVSYFNDKPFDSMDVKNSWDYAWISYDINDHTNDGKYGFELQDENGNVLCSASCNVGTKPTETPTATPKEGDLTDYNRISDIVNDNNSLYASKIVSHVNTAITGIGFGVASIDKNIKSSKDDVETKLKTVNDNVKSLQSSFDDCFNDENGTVTSYLNDIKDDINNINFPDLSSLSNQISNFTSTFNDYFNLDDGVFTRYFNNIKHDVDNINFPDLSGLSSSVEDVKSAISNITFPDLTGLSSTIDNVKSTLDNLSFPSLSEISNLLGSAKDDIRNDLSFIGQTISNERDNIYGHIDSKTSELSSGLSSLIRSVKTDLSNMDIPDAASIFESFNSVESKIDSLTFPSLKSIEDTIINAAETIADKILERILNEIERRYQK